MSLNRLIKDQLGMPLGTASNRLRKRIMFSLVVRVGLDTCFKCGGKISNPDDLSVDHKKPWRGESESLFWDLDNVAFSHRKCNTADRKRGRSASPKKENILVGISTTAVSAKVQEPKVRRCLKCGTVDDLHFDRLYCMPHWRERERERMKIRTAALNAGGFSSRGKSSNRSFWRT